MILMKLLTLNVTVVVHCSPFLFLLISFKEINWLYDILKISNRKIINNSICQIYKIVTSQLHFDLYSSMLYF